jgi:hypothetical protein
MITTYRNNFRIVADGKVVRVWRPSTDSSTYHQLLESADYVTFTWCDAHAWVDKQVTPIPTTIERRQLPSFF